MNFLHYLSQSHAVKLIVIERKKNLFMKNRYLFCVMAVCIPLLGVSCGSPPFPRIDDLIYAYSEAVNGGDRDAYINTLHPLVLKVLQQEYGWLLDQIIQRDFKQPVPEGGTVEISVLDPGPDEIFESMMYYVVRPTHAVHIENTGREGAEGKTELQAVRENGSWYRVLPLPAGKRIDRMKAAAEATMRVAVEAEALFSTLEEDSCDRILKQVRKGEKNQAIRDFRARNGVGLAVARAVVERVMIDNGLELESQ